MFFIAPCELHIESALLNDCYHDLRYLLDSCPVCWSSPNHVLQQHVVITDTQMGPHQSESTSLLCLCAPCPPTPAASPTVSESMSLSPCVRSLQQPYTLPPGHNASGKSCFLLWLLHQSQADILWPLEGPDHTEISCYCNAPPLDTYKHIIEP